MNGHPDGLGPFLVEFGPLLAGFLVDAVVFTATLHVAASVVYGWKTAFRAALIGSTVAVVHSRSVRLRPAGDPTRDRRRLRCHRLVLS